MRTITFLFTLQVSLINKVVRAEGETQSVITEGNTPIVVINADDYYGPEVFKAHYDYLMQEQNSNVYEFCMGGYKIENTLLPQGSVTRGVCITKDGYLSHIDERKIILVGPCSADNEDSVCDYVSRLAKINDKVKENIKNFFINFIVKNFD